MGRQTRWLALALIGALSLNLLLLPAGAAPTELQIISPGVDLHRFERPPIEVKVRLTGDALAFRARLNGREVTERFRPLTGGVLRATFTAEHLQHGVNRFEARLGSQLATRTFRVRSLLGEAPGQTPGAQRRWVPIQTRIISGDGSVANDYAIKVGDQAYTAPAIPGGGAVGYQIVLLDRTTLELKSNISVPVGAGQGGNLYQAVYGLPDCGGEPGCLIVVQSLAQAGYTPRCDQNFRNCDLAGTPGEILFGLGGTFFINFVNGFTPHLGYSLISTLTSAGPTGAGQGFERLICDGSADCASPYSTQAAGNGAISGALILDNNGAYTFAYPGRATFEVTPGATTSTVKIGGTPNGGTYTSDPLPAGYGAFHVVAIYRDSLQLVYNNTFNFNQLSASDPSAWTMERALREASQNGNYLIFVSSIGPLEHDAWPYQWSAVAQRIADLGGTYSLFWGLKPGDDYSLVGAQGTGYNNGGAEASSILSRATTSSAPPSNLRGVLAQDRFGNYSVASSRLTSTDAANESSFEDFALARLDAIALRPPTAWPVVNSSDPSAANYCDPNNQRPGDAGTCLAYRYVSLQLTAVQNADLRSIYTDTDIRPAALLALLDTLVLPSGAAFTQADLDNIRAQLRIELQYVSDIRALLGNITSLQTQQQTSLTTILQGAYQAVSDGLQPPSDAKINPKWQAVISIAETLSGDAAAIAGGPAAKGALDMAWGVYNFGAAGANSPNGQPLQSLETTFDQLEQKSVDDFNASLVVIGNLFDLILTDWGRLQALGVPLAGGQVFNWDPSLNGAILASLDRAVRREYFTKLIGASFEMGHWTNLSEGSAPDLNTLCGRYTSYTVEVCPDGNCYGVVKCDTPGSDDENWIALPSSLAPGQGGDLQNYDLWMIGTDVRCSANKNGGLLGPLFAPIDPNDPTKLGIYKPYFFLHTPIFTRTNESCSK